MSKFFDETMLGLLEALDIKCNNSEENMINDKKFMTSYCPICDEEKIICSANTIYHCPKCKHHLNLHPIKLEKVDIENESEH